MAKQRNRRRETPAPTPFEQARDELFQHIMRCGVIQAVPEHQEEWFHDTMPYLQDRYPELSDGQLSELRTLGTRFCRPPKAKTEGETNEPADAVSAA
ncbi:MAG TPA: hypothetical protein VFW04_13040 [Gemmatimonadaceae bacterium]|nr:hypothetical protein [Gemmatimonadaceae bacterium]